MGEKSTQELQLRHAVVSRHPEMCLHFPTDENKRVTRLCQVQDGSSCVLVCGLSLAPSSLNPLLRALKLQASLTELRISGNRLSDDLLPVLVATAITMPRLRLLDISANSVTGEGLEKAANALRGQSHAAFLVRGLSWRSLFIFHMSTSAMPAWCHEFVWLLLLIWSHLPIWIVETIYFLYYKR